MKAKYYDLKKDAEKREKYMEKIMKKDLGRMLDSDENEVLYGRAGYLSAIAFIRLLFSEKSSVYSERTKN